MDSVETKTQVLDRIRSLFMYPPLDAIVTQVTRRTLPGSLFSKIAPNHYQYHHPTLKRVKRFGLEFELDVSDLVDWHIYYGLKAIEMRRFEELIQPGSTIIDIGGNVGWQTLEAAQRTGDQGQVFTFEPHPVNLERLRRNVSLNAFRNITIFPKGLSNRPGEADFGVEVLNNLGMTRLLSENEAASAHSIRRAEITTLDHEILPRSLQAIDLIKIDVEGLEIKVLQGAEKVIHKYRPILFIEVNQHCLDKYGESTSSLIQKMLDLGYRVVTAHDNCPLTPSTVFPRMMVDAIGYPI